jgi:flagellar motor switch protein FliG
MSKTIVSAFDSQKTATRLLASAIASGFDSRLFSIISSSETEETPLDSLRRVVPSILARLYRKHLRMGNSLLVAQVPEHDVARLIKLLQSTGGHDIEACDQINAA